MKSIESAAVAGRMLLLLCVIATLLGGCLTDQSNDHERYACLDDADCLSGYVCAPRSAPYSYGVCVPEPDVSDVVEDLDEGLAGDSATDHGPDGQPVDVIDADDVAPEPTCDDGLQNGSESDVDCGGSDCLPCDMGDRCTTDGDCVNEWCGSGGTCSLRPDGAPCEQAEECLSEFCGDIAGNRICGTQCGGTGICPAGERCNGEVCVADDLCQRQSNNEWFGPACTCDICASPANCVNINDVVTCTCSMGYEYVRDGCYDVDECQELPAPCPQNETCTNEPGTFSCSCDAPYAPDFDGICECPAIEISAGGDVFAPGARMIMLEAFLQPGATGMWSIVSVTPTSEAGTGSFSDPTDPGATFSGSPNAVYELEWTVDNGCAVATETAQITFDPCSGERTFTDPRDGLTYPVGPIKGVCWMLQNLNHGMILDGGPGLPIPSDNGVVEKYCYKNDPANCTVDGGLYPHEEIMKYGSTSAQGICPMGWRIPTTSDYGSLGANRAYDALAVGEHMMATDALGWHGRLAGRYDAVDSVFLSDGSFGYHWSSEIEPGGGTAYAFKLYDDGTVDTLYPVERRHSVSVRCVRAASR